MITESKTGLHAMQYKVIDGLQIRFATNDKKKGDPILLLSPLPESILAFFLRGTCSHHWVRLSQWISLHSDVPKPG
jgi:hypothetical protein